jgi:hypothetical protein
MALGLCGAAVGAESLRIRVAWGGGAERLWEGTIAISQGTLSEPKPLGIEADESGSMWLEEGRLVIRQRTARAYDGVDLLVSAPLDAKLLVQLTAANDSQRGPQVEIPPIPLADLSTDLRNLPLDNRDNRLLVRRAPGDSLRVRTAESSMVFPPGARFKLDVMPCLLTVPPDSKVHIKAQLTGAREQRELWSMQYDVRAGQVEAIPLEVPLPEEEGVYDLTLTATETASWTHPVRPALHWKRSLADRRVQVLVLSRQRPPAKALHELAQVLEIDPANPHWWEKVKLPQLPQLPRLPRLPKGPLGNGTRQTVQHPLGELAQLAPSARSPDVSWEAYWLNISVPGRPYVLEVDYPSDVPQTLGISILEPNAAGALVPIGLDSGVDVAEELVGGDAPRWAHHRLVFWPRTSTPLVLMTNRREASPAVYGKIRVLGGWDRLPPLAAAVPSGPQRLWTAYMDRPLLPENFSANELLDTSGGSLDDWTTFHEAGTRLVEYLQYAGYNSLMLCVVADGSALYPSEFLEPTPRYDTGVFFANAQDPLRKDVLEMLLRLMDREGLQLIPAVELAAPLPALEALRRGPPAQRDGLEWIGPDGAAWTQTYAPRRGLAPYYNLLDPRVQDAVLAVLRELVQRYGQHPSFAGLAVRLSAYGYAQLPGPEWGMDDATIARFEQDAHLRVPGEGRERFAARSAFLNSDAHRDAWLQWRADQCCRFYRRVRDMLSAVRPDAPLYLAGAEMFAGAEMAASLRPALPPKATLAEALLAAGFDPRHYQEDRGLVLLRPERIVPAGKLAAQAAELELGQMPEADFYFHGLPRPGSLFFHPPQEVHVPSFDQKSPFKQSFAWLVTEAVPSGAQNRRRFVHSLATMDSQILVDGGWLLPLGQEDATRSVAAAFRSLPPLRFTAVEGPAGGSQPVTLRTASVGGRTYVYAVNDAPFGTLVRVPLQASPECTLRELSGLRKIAPLTRDADGAAWIADLEPYDLLAIELSEAGVRVGAPQVQLPAAVETALGQRIRQLGTRAAALRNPPLLRVLENPGFERAATAAEPVPGWAVSRRLGVTLGIDKTHAHGGSQSARIASDGPIACLVSRPFEPPSTGRLSMLVWLRTADAARQPPLRLAVEGKLAGRDYYRYTAVGRPAAAGQAAVPIAAAWGCYIFQVDDLPLEGLSQLRVRFDLMGEGEVWVDDVQLFDLAFNESELRALYKLITTASATLQNGQVSDCMRLLESYWPRFLMENVPLGPAAPAELAARPDDSRSPAAAPKEKEPPPSGWLDRVRSLVPDRPW